MTTDTTRQQILKQFRQDAKHNNQDFSFVELEGGAIVLVNSEALDVFRKLAWSVIIKRDNPIRLELRRPSSKEEKDAGIGSYVTAPYHIAKYLNLIPSVSRKTTSISLKSTESQSHMILDLRKENFKINHNMFLVHSEKYVHLLDLKLPTRSTKSKNVSTDSVIVNGETKSYIALNGKNTNLYRGVDTPKHAVDSDKPYRMRVPNNVRIGKTNKPVTGYFSTAKEAAIAYDDTLVGILGVDAYYKLNFPNRYSLQLDTDTDSDIPTTHHKPTTIPEKNRPLTNIEELDLAKGARKVLREALNLKNTTKDMPKLGKRNIVGSTKPENATGPMAKTLDVLTNTLLNTSLDNS